MIGPELVFFHTAEVHRGTFGALAAEIAPEMEVRHVVRADLLAAAARRGGVDADLDAEVQRSLLDASRGAAVVLCTCSTLGPSAERAGEGSTVPILRVDRAMAAAAVAIGGRVLVAACVETTLAPTRALVESEAARQQRSVEIELLHLPDAWPLFERGDTEAYLDAIAAALRAAAPRADVIVLAQASMAGAAERCRDLGVAVLASPRLGVLAAKQAADDADKDRLTLTKID